MAKKKQPSNPPKSSGTGGTIERGGSGVRLAIAGLLSLVWVLLLWSQPIAENTLRWILLLIPDATFGAWFDGPVTVQGVVDRAAVVGVAVLVVAQAAAGGGLLLRGFGGSLWFARLDRIALAAALGLGIQANVILLLGLGGGLRLPAAACSVAVATWGCGALGGWLIRRLLARAASSRALPPTQTTEAERAAEVERGEPAGGWGTKVPRLVAGLFALLLIFRAVLPPAEYDVREYHLQAAKEWWQAGEIGFLPHNIYANMPMAAESHAIAGMMWFDLLGFDDADAWWWGALAGKLVIAAYAILAALLVGGVARRLLGVARGNCDPAAARLAAEWSVVLAIAFPGVVEVSSLGLIESAVAMYLAAGLLFAVARDSEAARGDGAACSVVGAAGAGGTGGANRVAVAVGLGLASGFALACKYPAVVLVVPVLAACLVFPPAIAVPGTGVEGAEGQGESEWRRLRRVAVALRRCRPGEIGVFVLAAFLAGGSWYAKNAVLAGNPVYPLLGNWLGGETLTSAKVEQWNRGHAVPGYSLEQLGGSIAGLLWGWRLQGWLVVPAVLWGVLLAWRYPAVRWLAASGGYAFAAWWLVTHRLERFLLPAAPLMFVLAAFGIAAWFRVTGAGGVGVGAGGVRWGTGVLCGLAAMNALYVASPVLGDSRIAVDLRYLRRDDESKSSIARLPEHVRWVNEHLGAEDRILIVGDAAVFDYEVPLSYSTTFDRSPLAEVIERPESEWSAALAEQGHTHLLVHWGEIQRLRSTYGFDERITPELVARMLRAGAIKPLKVNLNQGAVQVYEVVPHRGSVFEP
ncbi:hypothetical protein [Candidatus Laterigemmans baculatus]|uniref:hypothetical protein n=1 Tax=Candidatus Laterigemmans baculatus TaxID=2770505 RepID=UPI0013DD0238|nr:hypothetical protein [Candidatus Laterigemmans baculatus]